MLAGIDSSKLESDNTEEGSDITFTHDVPLSALAIISSNTIGTVLAVVGTIFENGGTQFKGPRDYVA